jgi:hypothetical protein
MQKYDSDTAKNGRTTFMTARHIFVSYSRRDRDVVKALTSFIKLGGATVFRDEDSIEPGEEWAKVLKDSIKASEWIVLFWSANAATSDFVTAEWALGVYFEKKVAPILLDKTPLPAELRKFQHLDYSDFVVAEKREEKDHLIEPGKTSVRAKTKDHWKVIAASLWLLGMAAPPLLPLFSTYLVLNDNEEARRKLAEKLEALVA